MLRKRFQIAVNLNTYTILEIANVLIIVGVVSSTLAGVAMGRCKLFTINLKVNRLNVKRTQLPESGSMPVLLFLLLPFT